MKKILTKTLKILGISIGTLLLLMLLLPLFFPHLISDRIKKWTNSELTTQLNFSDAKLSFFNHFPSLTLTLEDVSLMGSDPYPKDPLFKARELSFGIDLTTVFSSSIHINEIYLDQADISVRVNKQGAGNYNVYKPVEKSSKSPSDSTGTALKIERIQINDSRLLYQDLSIPILVSAKHLNYTGEGNFSQAIFDLSSKIRIDSFDLKYGGTRYVQSKKIKGRLITRLNTHSLQLEFKKNNLLLNSLPVKFTGTFSFLPQGYAMNLKLSSHRGNLSQVLSALPPDYDSWLAQTQTDGKTDVEAYLEGKYIASRNVMPNLGIELQIRAGSINNQKAPDPIKNLFLNLDAQLPSLNTDSLKVNIDSLFFNIGKDYFSSVTRLKGLHTPTLHAKINAEMDLSKWDRALGIASVDLRGILRLHLTADGTYDTRVEKKGIRQLDTVIASIPHFSLQSSLRNGYIKLGQLHQPIHDIHLDLDASNPDGNYRHTEISLNHLHANLLSDSLDGRLQLKDLNRVDANFHALMHLQNIQAFYPLDHTDLAGTLSLDVISKGLYEPSRGQFPVTHSSIRLENGRIRTSYYPDPVENIQILMNAENKAGTLADLIFKVKPISFNFEGQPFQLKADLENFHNLHYDIASRGIIDIGKLYQVFAIKGLSVKGLIKTHLFLKGLQSDAAAGRFDRLYNSGTAELKDIALQSDYFPRPFFIKTGFLRFDQDKMWFSKFVAVYGKSTLSLGGYLSNIVNYATSEKAPIEGQLELSSNHLFADEFTAFSVPADSVAAANTGVVIIPSNLNLGLKADIKSVTYQGNEIKNLKGAVSIRKGVLTLDSTSFEIIGAPVIMQASYQSLSPLKARFDYQINTRNFDIQRAYHEIRLFHDLASSAAKVHGMVSLQYRLSGPLNADMKPLYPSLKGNGVLSLQDVKVKGLKLFGALGKAARRDSINNPHLKQIDIKTSIANNIITIERTRLKIFGFRPRFQGQVSFDGKLDLSGRLGLPPLGIIGLPFSVTGTEETPKVKLKKARPEDKLSQTPANPQQEP